MTPGEWEAGAELLMQKRNADFLHFVVLTWEQETYWFSFWAFCQDSFMYSDAAGAHVNLGLRPAVEDVMPGLFDRDKGRASLN